VPAVTLVLEAPADPVAADLAAALAHECTALGARVTADAGAGGADDGAVPVLVAPLERAPRVWDPASVRESVLLCTARPGTRAYEDTVVLARAGGAPVLSPDAPAVRALRGLGIAAERLEVGPSEAWRRPPAGEVDVAVADAFSFRRARALAVAAEPLGRWRCALHLPGELDAPVDAPAVFAGARVAMLLHGHDEPGFPWVRAAQAAMHGCALVVERSSDAAPLRAGAHYLAAGPAAAGLLAQVLLEDEARRRALADAGAAALAAAGGMRAGAERLLALAAGAARRGPVVRPRPACEPLVLDVPPPPDTAADEDDAARRRRAKEERLSQIAARRATARAAAGPRADAVDVVAATPAWESGPPAEVTALVSVFDDAGRLGEALDSLAVADGVALEVVVVDDSSADGSAERARAWLGRCPDVPAILLRHAVNRGLPAARNTALARARTPRCFVLDSDNAVLPGGLALLRDALDGDPRAAFAYGMLAMFDDDGPHGLRSRHPWQPRLLRHANPIDAMALVRTRVARALGGWTTDLRLYGWEDYDLWCAIAERGGHGAFVPSIVARYRVSGRSMSASIADLSTASAYEALVERHPALMAGVVPPR
jgi:hypothetical protein